MKNLFFLPFPLHFSSGRVSGAGKGGNLRGGRRRKERGGPGFCELSKIGVVVGRTDGTGRNDARGEGGRRRGKRSKKKKFPPRHEKRKRRLAERRSRKGLSFYYNCISALAFWCGRSSSLSNIFRPSCKDPFFLLKPFEYCVFPLSLFSGLWRISLSSSAPIANSCERNSIKGGGGS